MAKLQNPVKSSFDSINDSLKESHSSLNKYSKVLDKVDPMRASSLLSLLRSNSCDSFSKIDHSPISSMTPYHPKNT